MYSRVINGESRKALPIKPHSKELANAWQTRQRGQPKLSAKVGALAPKNLNVFANAKTINAPNDFRRKSRRKPDRRTFHYVRAESGKITK